MNKQEALDHLIAEGTLRSGAWRNVVPPQLPQVSDRIRGMLLGVAIGDALGNTTESQNPDKRVAERGEIRDYLPNWYANNRAVGVPSDDTQLTFRAVQQLLDDGEFVPEHLLRSFATQPIFGIGQGTKEAIGLYQPGRFNWSEIGAPSAGNGSFMRMAPTLLPYVRSAKADIWTDAVLSTAITHRDSAAIATSVAWTAILWDLLSAHAVPGSDWWISRFVSIAQNVESESKTYRPRGGEWTDFDGRLSTWVERCGAAFAAEPDIQKAGRLWYSGAFLLETVPSVLHVLSRYADDPEEAIVRAVNDTRDNDTVAAIVGAAIGALHGTAAFPSRWKDRLLGRTGADDDGRVFELIDLAVDEFVTPQT